MKRFLFTMTVGLMVLLCSTFAHALPEKSAFFYVNDAAGLLSDATKTEIVETAAALERESGAQIVVVTVISLEGQSPPDFAKAVADAWQVGTTNLGKSLILLLSPGEGKVWIETGTSLKRALNSDLASRYIQKYALAAYEARDYDSGTLELYRALLSAVQVEYGLEELPGYPPLKARSGLSISTAIILISLVLMMLILGRKRRQRGGSSSSGGISSGYSTGYRGEPGAAFDDEKENAPSKNLRDGSKNYRYRGLRGRGR